MAVLTQSKLRQNETKVVQVAAFGGLAENAHNVLILQYVERFGIAAFVVVEENFILALLVMQDNPACVCPCALELDLADFLS